MAYFVQRQIERGYQNWHSYQNWFCCLCAANAASQKSCRWISVANQLERLNDLRNVLKNHKYEGAQALQDKLNASVAALKACQAKGAFVDIYRDNSVQEAMDVINELDEELNKAAEWIVKQ